MVPSEPMFPQYKNHSIDWLCKSVGWFLNDGSIGRSEAVVQRCSVKRMLQISKNSLENTCARVSFLIKLQALGLQLYYEAVKQVFSYKFCKIFESTFFIEYLWRLLLVVLRLKSAILKQLQMIRFF